MIHYVNGDLLESNANYICHQVNCQGKMNAGIAKSIREKYPYVYQAYLNWYKEEKRAMLGHIQIIPIVNGQNIVNMAAQMNYGYFMGKPYTSYEAFMKCLYEIKRQCPKGCSIGFPDHIGCCRGGANWERIKEMIEDVLGSIYEIYIYKL